jgi:hypothetical protein
MASQSALSVCLLLGLVAAPHGQTLFDCVNTNLALTGHDAYFSTMSNAEDILSSGIGTLFALSSSSSTADASLIASQTVYSLKYTISSKVVATADTLAHEP